jgi:hypothetical protein
MILAAMQQSLPQAAKRRKMKEIEPDPLVDGPDAICQLAQRKKRQPKVRKLSQWTGADFIRYMQKNLDQYGLQLDAGVGMRDSSWILRLHDLLIDHFPGANSNKLVRDYIDWWVAVHARLQGDSIYLGLLVQSKYIDQFVESHANKPSSRRRLPSREQNTPPANVDDTTLYELGGLSMLLMSSGIVRAYRILRNRNESNILSRLSTIIRGLSKQVTQETMNRTINGGPYPHDDLVDFISVARPALKYHGIKNYDTIDYRDFFTEK